MNRLAWMAAVAVIGGACSAGRAGPFDSVDIQYWAGSGASQAAVVVDFGPGANYAFGYRWDGNATGWDALAAIDQGGSLDVDATWYAAHQAHLVNDFSYGVASKGSGMSWGYYTSSDGAAWAESWVGADGRMLADGDYDGWSWGDYDTNTYAHLRAPTTPPVPEPASAALLALAGAALAARRRGRRN